MNISSIQTCLHPNTFESSNLDNKIYEQFKNDRQSLEK